VKARKGERSDQRECHAIDSKGNPQKLG
jgi:hypothetical protein